MLDNQSMPTKLFLASRRKAKGNEMRYLIQTECGKGYGAFRVTTTSGITLAYFKNRNHAIAFCKELSA